MNSVFTAKLLNNLRNKKGNKGFTLIELLVVVIIIGVLAAVALPNLLAQVGKARETEGKNAMGTINRAQQAYHFEAGTFSPAIADTGTNGLDTVNNPLGVAIDSQYYTFSVGNSFSSGAVTGNGDGGSGLAAAAPVNANSDGVRGYSGAIAFDGTSGLYGTAVCQGSGVGVTPTPSATSSGAATTCSGGTKLR